MERERPAGPRELVDALTVWAGATPWVDWLELGGSLGRGAGDERSDVDAGIGIVEPGGLDQVEEATSGFAPVAATLRQHFDEQSTHLVTVYRDGRQLSLVVMPRSARSGLPPEAIVLVDKTGRLAERIDPDRWAADATRLREWTFLACIAAGDALKHAFRGHLWRAVGSLAEGRDLCLRLTAAARGVVFPQFGAISLENADQPVPAELADTLVGTLDVDTVRSAVAALNRVLAPYVAEHGLDDLSRAIARSASDGDQA